ncbi:hypothetical protein ACWCXB_03525 [Streptomyces sp. NPDC001514]
MTEVSALRDEDGTRTVRQASTGLTKALAPAPPPMPHGYGCLGVFATLVSIGTFIGGIQAGHWFEDEPGAPADAYNSGLIFPQEPVPDPPNDFAFLGWISAIALLAAAALFVVSARRRAAYRRILAGRPAAEELWSRAWYCGRCGTVQFPDTPGQPRRALSLREFREIVWQAGGYGHLTQRHPVV